MDTGGHRPYSTIIDPSLFVLLSAAVKSRAQRAALAAQYADQNSRDAFQIQSDYGYRRRNARILFRTCPITSIVLSDGIKAALRVRSSATAALFKNMGDHAKLNHPDHAGRILNAPPKTEEQLRFIGRDHADDGKFELVFSDRPHSYVFTAVKFRSDNGIARCWIDTAFLLNHKSLRKKIRKLHLLAYQGTDVT